MLKRQSGKRCNCKCRKIMIMHDQYTTMCVFLRNSEHWLLGILKKTRHLQKMGGFYYDNMDYCAKVNHVTFVSKIFLYLIKRINKSIRIKRQGLSFNLNSSTLLQPPPTTPTLLHSLTQHHRWVVQYWGISQYLLYCQLDTLFPLNVRQQWY